MTLAEPLLSLSHTPPPVKGHKLLSAYDIAKLGFFLFGFPRNGFGSIDVSKECNLRCKHCYFFEQDYESEFSVEQWVAKLEDLKRTRSRLEFPFFQCTWVGGEPLIRKDLIERGRKYFRYNTVVTNGTIPLPEWPDVNWYISIDGDEETHERIRNKKGIYKRAMRNIAEHPDLNVTIAYCITRGNVHCLEQAIIDWAAAGATRMTFDFYTPIETIEEREQSCGDSEGLFLPLHERDRVLDQLIALKKIYGDFFVLPERVFRMMKSDVAKQVTDNCLFATKSFAFGPTGVQKEKCMMGPKADCDRCGCVVPFYMASLTDRRRIVEDVSSELRHAARRAARGAVTAILG
ncbi:MAG: radical SAM protein [Myxococcales bacterium]|nr:radical SAM protein [Myxococcales bacterium]